MPKSTLEPAPAESSREVEKMVYLLKEERHRLMLDLAWAMEFVLKPERFPNLSERAAFRKRYDRICAILFESGFRVGGGGHRDSNVPPPPSPQASPADGSHREELLKQERNRLRGLLARMERNDEVTRSMEARLDHLEGILLWNYWRNPPD